jgi:hypothetical protein
MQTRDASPVLRWFRLFLSVSLALSLGGCALFRLFEFIGPKIDLVSIDVVESVDHYEIERTTLSEKLLRVTITSHLDLEGEFGGFSFFSDASGCTETELDQTKLFLGYPGLYDDEGRLTPASTAPREKSAPRPYTYHLYVSLENSKIRDRYLYDLRSSPEDVCLQISGASQIGQRFRSNTIIIPKDQISKAISEVNVSHGSPAKSENSGN